MDRLAWLQTVRRVAAKQHGVITRAQLLDAGVPERTIDRMLHRGDLERILPAVFLAQSGDPWTQLLVAALAWAGPEAVASHLIAGQLHGLYEATYPQIEITVPRKLKSPHPKVTVHISEVPQRDRRRVNGFPVTAVERTLIDLASKLAPIKLEHALDESLRRGLTKLTRVAQRLEELGSRGRPGAGTLRSLIAARDPSQAPTDSDLEELLFSLIRRAGLPEPVRQHPVPTAHKRYFIDLAYPDHQLALECDGYAFHSGRRRMQKDLERQNILINAGWRILRFTWADIVGRGERTIALIAAALAEPGRARAPAASSGG